MSEQDKMILSSTFQALHAAAIPRRYVYSTALLPHEKSTDCPDVKTQKLKVDMFKKKPHIDVSLTCEHDPKLQDYCVCPQNMPQFDSEGIPNQAPETNKPMILNGPTSRNRQGSDQVQNVIQSFDVKDAFAIPIAQHLLVDSSIKQLLEYIESNYGFIPDCETALENSGTKLVDQISLLRNIWKKVTQVDDKISKITSAKITNMLKKMVDIIKFSSAQRTYLRQYEYTELKNTEDYVKLIYKFTLRGYTSSNCKFESIPSSTEDLPMQI
ncbi:hypothetical protein ANN_18790 [Periplaneta americana]|uniref:Uncharacterized protein n=1 Tax=Periplaneta americana TaxID=6978 RepID=A0ABQ8SR15_PERAM|nr:hypothetical protein ANN_18790 [Periplaneta americana]